MPCAGTLLSRSGGGPALSLVSGAGAANGSAVPSEKQPVGRLVLFALAILLVVYLLRRR